MTDEYRTIEAGISCSTRVEFSRFLAEAIPVDSREAAELSILEIRQRYHDANHHCFAYRIGSDGAVVRFSDDGEPGGTAGKSILGMIDKRKLTNILVVVTRYFGGIKLGTGGLSRAYAESAESVLKLALEVVRFEKSKFNISFAHELTGRVMRIVSKYEAEICDRYYDEEVSLNLVVRKSILPKLLEDLVSSTGGKVRAR
jgi:uncharacterized YigZ family protein